MIETKSQHLRVVTHSPAPPLPWQHEGDLHKLAKQLLEQETMTAAQIIALLEDNGGKAIEEATRVEEMVAETSVDNVEGGDFDGAAS